MSGINVSDLDPLEHERRRLVNLHLQPSLVRLKALGNCDLQSAKSGVKSSSPHKQKIIYEGADIGPVYITVSMVSDIIPKIIDDNCDWLLSVRLERIVNPIIASSHRMHR